jgi:hypothetical protein
MLNRHIGMEIRTMVSRLLAGSPTDQRDTCAPRRAADGQFDAGPDRVTAMKEDERVVHRTVFRPDINVDLDA